MTLTAGRIVQFVPPNVSAADAEAEARPALITDVLSPSTGLVSLCVFNVTGFAWPQEIAHADTPTPGCWNWPPRV
ncbi:hypothetical protein I5H03_gp003 [Mycobacterium phage Nibb]|uniref:Uncharacterized protein n=1 Tax=Mycobacterium phage Nibb TaxID=2510585 RepID=A0A411B5C7_9CAUD|nr:hypothetical protein I5H03_gp003 [Mycobacterium phage Nibb]QAX95543.1 hypothetical protein SEA_NIBB_3 [Mycobacterium phage Nibb]